MELLVSVRDAEEARTAVSAGAHIIDAKDPGAGGLGMVDGPTLGQIRGAVPHGLPLSAALGDPTSAAEVRRKVRVSTGANLWFVKQGFAGTPHLRRAAFLLETTVRASYRWLGSPAVVAVAYADWERARSPEPALLVGIASAAGAHGLLLDTALKTGAGLFDLWSEDRIADLVGAGQDQGLFVALAGGLGLAEIARAAAVGADVVGVRGAACEAGRSGPVSASRIVALRAAVDRLSTGYGPWRYSRQRSNSLGPTTRHGIPAGSASRK